MLQLDLRSPTLVLAGAWNPAIFQPGWMLQHIQGLPQGQEATIGQLLIAEPTMQKNITFFDQIGIFVSNNRIEIYVNQDGPEASHAAEAFAGKIITTLPHSPMTALGINFRFDCTDAEADVYDRFNVSDLLSQRYEIKKTEIMSNIGVEETVDLNFRRMVDSDKIAFNFNYHHLLPLDTDGRVAVLRDVIQRRLAHAADLLEGIYGLAGFSVQNHEI